ncbi:uncharacterized protein LOC124121862 isoform X1 [Haliotis rufescens]|uniref:uncharacterized protein LOC124121862 isoform X1 n=2 Tax=Haliotis rufescens TaxID=6454 RepID=UPI00201E8030|nr:uncharacterized protein LOC124121862 isoform X1 [Haliotis rufescens]
MGMERLTHRSTKFGDPFGRDPPPKAFYHPSKQKKLGKKQKEITLSPARDGSKARRVSPTEDMFLKGTNIFSVKTPAERSDHSSQFDESWPSSDRPSSSSPESGGHRTMLDSLSQLKSALDRTDRQSVKSTDTRTQTRETTAEKGYVLQSYIDRFRYGVPMSRAERSQKEDSNRPDFWWLAHSPPTPSDTSTPKDDLHPRSRQFTDQGEKGGVSSVRTHPTRRDHTGSVMTLQGLSEPALDDVTRRLQERAARLLEESGSSLHSSEPAVSTDGLGTTSGTMGSSFEEMPYRPMFTRLHDPIGRPDVRSAPIKLQRPSRPEEDILYQWRLRRKMETAQQGHPGLGVKVTGSNKDIDSKLDAFRRRLTGAVDPDPMTARETISRETSPRQTTPSHTASSVHFTPAPSTDKVDAQVQTRKSLEAGPPEKTSVHTPPKQKPSSSKPEIASPTLHRHKHSGMKTDPHLHLMCDLLPCPHAQKYSRNHPELYKQSSEFSESEEVSSDQAGVQYKQFLQAEKPHSEEKRLRRKHDSDRTRDKDEEVDEDDDVGSGEEEQVNIQVSDGLDLSESDGPSPRRQCKGRQLRSCNNEKGGYYAVEGRQLGKHLQHRQSKNREIVGRDEHERGVERSSREGPSQNVQGVTDSRGKAETKRVMSGTAGVLPRPAHSSSPARKPQSLSSAIGQTVSEHLFEGSASCVLSSVDSWASATDQSQTPSMSAAQRRSQAPLQSADPQRSEVPPTYTPPSLEALSKPTTQDEGQTEVKVPVTANQEDTNEVYESDGDYPDDHILKMLRQQRAEYEIKLSQIDDLLQQSSFAQR